MPADRPIDLVDPVPSATQPEPTTRLPLIPGDAIARAIADFTQAFEATRANLRATATLSCILGDRHEQAASLLAELPPDRLPRLIESAAMLADLAATVLSADRPAAHTGGAE